MSSAIFIVGGLLMNIALYISESMEHSNLGQHIIETVVRAKGKTETQKDIIIRMRQNNISNADISKYLGLDLTEIEQISK